MADSVQFANIKMDKIQSQLDNSGYLLSIESYEANI